MHSVTALPLLFCFFLRLSNVLASSAVPTYVPVPSKAAGPPIPTDVGYRLQSFGDGGYMVTDGVYQALFFVTTESVVVVDAPPTIGENMVGRS
jgi:hypothetical protein